MAGALVNSKLMIGYNAWYEILQGVLLLMSWVERRGRLEGLAVGVLILFVIRFNNRKGVDLLLGV